MGKVSRAWRLSSSFMEEVVRTSSLSESNMEVLLTIGMG